MPDPLPPAQTLALMQAATRGAEIRAEETGGEPGMPLLRHAPSHSAAHLLAALREQGWELTRSPAAPPGELPPEAVKAAGHVLHSLHPHYVLSDGFAADVLRAALPELYRAWAARSRALTSDEEWDKDTYERARAELAEWQEAGAVLWDLPAAPVHFVLGCHGAESVRVGTADALEAVSVECEECCGQGYHYDDSHPGNASTTCETCKGHRRVPPISAERLTDLDAIEALTSALGERITFAGPLDEWDAFVEAALGKVAEALAPVALTREEDRC